MTTLSEPVKCLIAAAIGVTALLASLVPPGLPSVTPTLAAAQKRKSVEERAADYVATYQEELTAIVADETYTQEVRRDPQEPGAQLRTTAGEVFFIFTTAGRGWMAIRDVLTIDGAPVRERTDVREILRTVPAAHVGDRMRSYNAQFNIGRITRNINEPTLALLSLDAGHRSRFRFTLKEREVRDGRVMVWLAFQERERPTLIRGLEGSPIYMKGELLVEAANGRIWQSRLTATVDRIDVELKTESRLDDRLGLMLPVVFRERYQRDKTLAADYEEIDCVASYSNFRRFEVSARVR
jgi:hypothetical protein